MSGEEGIEFGGTRGEFSRQELVHPILFFQGEESPLIRLSFLTEDLPLHYSQIIATLPLHKQETYFFGKPLGLQCMPVPVLRDIIVPGKTERAMSPPKGKTQSRLLIKSRG